MPSREEIARDARSLVRRAFKGSLATISAKNGYPYASLVTLATDASGAPTLLISSLARHTANLAKDPRASIMVEETEGLADPLQGARVTLYGTVERTKDEAVRRRFLARHPKAFYAEFSDFGIFRLAIEGAHYYSGFGRSFELTADELLVPGESAASLIEAEPEIVAHMNQDHADAVELYATALADGEPGPWRMTGIDTEGADVVLDGAARRILFAEPVTTPAEARKELVRLATEARAGRQ
jgi:putative heme iron utilization protein